MALIARPLKTTGQTNYASGSTTILATEVDADLNTIYGDYSGNVTNSNIAPAAAIATSKIAQDAGIVAAHLAASAVTTAKIAQNATMVNFQSVVVPSFSGITTTETQLFTLPAFTPRNAASRIVFFGAIGYYLETASVSGTAVILRLRRGVGGTTVQRVDYEVQSPSTSVHRHVFPAPVWLDTTPTVASTVYEITAQVNTVGVFSSVSTASRGTFYAIEFA